MAAGHASLPAILATARTPFLDTAGAYAELMTHELGAQAIAGVVQRSGVDPEALDMVSMGIVVHEVETTNIAREAMLTAGLPSQVPAYTTAMAGLSPNIGIVNLCDMIRLGRLELAIGGGMENFSDVPIRLSRNVRRMAMRLRQARSHRQRLRALARLRPGDLALDIPKGTDYTTRQTMGASTEAMVRKYPVTREECDAFALRSHQRAVQALRSGQLNADIHPVRLPGGGEVCADNTPREGLQLEQLARLKPVFDREQGVITAGNASRFTDGAAALLLGSLAAAERHGLTPQAVLVDAVFTGVADLYSEMLLGPAMAIPRLLERNRLTMDDIAVFEVHEAFAAQLLVNQVCLASDAFVRQRLSLSRAPGRIPEDRLNLWGGSLALGNPFAATGGRLIATASRRLAVEGGRYAVVSSCAGGGLGTALLLENADRY